MTSKKILLFSFFLTLYEVAIYLSNDAYLPALPFISNDLNTSQQLIQLTLTTWFLGSCSMQLFLGPITDQVGRRPVLLAGGLIFITSTIGCALVHNIYLLLLLRFIQGTTIASMFIPGYATIHELLDQKQAIHTLAIMSSITILAPAFGPLLGAVILNFSNWRFIFGILALSAMITIGGLFFKMPETRKESLEKTLFKQILLQYKNILSNKKFMFFSLTEQCFFAVMIAWITAGPFLLIDRFHFTTLDFSITQAFVFGSFIIGTRFVKRLMQALQLKTILRIGMTLLLAGGIYALFSALIWPNVFWNVLAAMMLLTLSAGLAFPILNRLAIESSTEPMGSKIAVNSLLMGLSSTLASIIISCIYNGALISLTLVLFVFSILPVILQYFMVKKMHEC